MDKLDGKTLAQMILLGAEHLENNSDMIDALNVFPVPDGDTGTNMNLSMSSGAEEVKRANQERVSDVSKAFSKGLLMGARGNSGVILSQLFRGFAEGIGSKKEVNTQELAEAFNEGVRTSYKAVMKPVEGTILTVAKDAARRAKEVAQHETNIVTLMEEVVSEAKASLARTPDLLPILKEVGVVDSGGQGLVTIYEGFLALLKGEELPEYEVTDIDMAEMVSAEHHKIAQDFMSADEIEYGYCTEFMIKLEKDKLQENAFNEEEFREELLKHGDSLVVVSDDEIVRVHVHTEYPGNAMTYAQTFGSLINIDIENMREQHSQILSQKKQEKKEKFALITVAMGSGIKELFESLGVSVVIEGGQTMNPSTKDITDAIEQVHAENIFILPNNKNIVMAAEQAAELAGDHVEVIPTTTIPQGITACLYFFPEGSVEENKEAMIEGMNEVKTGQVTYAIRDTKINDIFIDKGNFMGLADGDIKATHKDRIETTKELLKQLITSDDEIVTLLYGEDVPESECEQLTQFLEDNFEDVEVEVHQGNQPIYSYIIAVE